MSVRIPPAARTMVPHPGLGRMLAAAATMVAIGHGQPPGVPGTLVVRHAPRKSGRVKTRFYADNGVKPIAGRNEPCPCGSGKKFKACHRS